MAERATSTERTTLGPYCGHHCGTALASGARIVTRHCQCSDCHAMADVAALIPDQTERRYGQV